MQTQNKRLLDHLRVSPVTPFEQAERMAQQLKTIKPKPVKHHQEKMIIKTLLVGLRGN